MRALLPALALLAGCDVFGDYDLCEVDYQPVAMTSCVVAEGAAAAEYDLSEVQSTGALTAWLNGSVAQVGAGAPPEGCEDMAGWLEGGDATGEGWWFVLEDGEGARWTVATLGLYDAAPVEAGEAVEVQWRWVKAEPFDGEPGGSELFVGDWEGAPVAWVAAGRSFAEWDAPSELSIQLGEELARCPEDCLTRVHYALEVSLEGVSATLDTDTPADLGRLTVRHGGTTLSEDVTCSETSADYSRLAAWR
jgi:hypothetical protein